MHNIEDYRAMINKAVNNVKAGYEHKEDLEQEASLIFCEACNKHDPETGVYFGVFLSMCLKQLHNRYWYTMKDRLEKYGHTEATSVTTQGDSPGSIENLQPFELLKDFDLNLSYTELSTDAKVLHEAVVNETIYNANGYKLQPTIKNLAKLAEKWNWTIKRLMQALEEIKVFILEVFSSDQSVSQFKMA